MPQVSVREAAGFGRILMRDPRYVDRNVEVLAFYYPGEEALCDLICRVPFLGNLWALHDEPLTLTAEEAPTVGVPRQVRTYQFVNSEAAHQALKFWRRARLFEQIDGKDAIALSDRLSQHDVPDWSYGGYGDQWKGMVAVLRQTGD
jgi:hypothetical protein